jgi:archaellum component FlaC
MGMEAKDYERMATMEEQIKQLVQAVNSLTQKLDTWQGNYVPRQELGEMFRARDKDIQDLQTEIEKLRQEKNNSKPVVAAWAGVIVSVLAVAVAVVAIVAN